MSTILEPIYGPKLRKAIESDPHQARNDLDEDIIRMAKEPLNLITVKLEVAKDIDNNIYEYVEFVPTIRYVESGDLWLANERFTVNYTRYREQATFLFPPHMRTNGPLFPWE